MMNRKRRAGRRGRGEAAPPKPSARASARVRADLPAAGGEGRRWKVRPGVILGLTMLAFSVAPILNVVRREPFNKDYDLWQETGQIVLRGGDVYPRTFGLYPFMYPPSCAAMLALPSALPRGMFVGGLLALNSASWAFCVLASVYLATGRVRGHSPWLYLLPSAAVAPFVHDTYLLGQPAIFLLALLLGAFVCLRTRRPVAAGALIALSAAVKAYPVLAIGYLVYRRQWRATASAVVTLLALMFVFPTAFRSPSRVVEDVSLWTRGMVLKYDERSIGQRPDRAYSFKNQSIQATVHRLARPVLANGENDKRWRVNLLNLDFRQTTVLMAASVGAIGLFYLVTSWRAGSQPPPADAVDGAMVTMLVVMLAPLSFNYSYVWLVFPLTVLLSVARTSPGGSPGRRLALGTAAAAVGLLALALPMRQTAQAYGNVFFSGLVVFFGLGIVLLRGCYTPAVDPGGARPARNLGSQTASGRPAVEVSSGGASRTRS